MATTTSTTPALDLPSARQLRDGLAALLRAERTAAAEFLLALSEFDRRRGWELLGHASLFAFLMAELRLSRSAAFWRLSAARLLQQFPDVIEPLRDGRLCMTTTAELAKVLTAENQATVLPRFFGLSVREAQEVTAELMPRADPPLRAVVTTLPTLLPLVTPPAVPTPQLAVARQIVASVSTPEPLPAPAARGVTVPRDDVEPLTADLRRLHVTVSRQFLKKLEAARDGLSHSIPGASTEQVLEAALDLLLEKRARRRGLVKRPRKATLAAATAQVHASDTAEAAKDPLHRREGPREAIPAPVNRAVWERDEGRCVWPLDAGGRCGSTHQVEIDHSAVPWARGGAPTVDNLRLLCHRHNALAARRTFGERYMEKYAARSRAARPSAGSPGAPATVPRAARSKDGQVSRPDRTPGCPARAT